MSIVERAAKRIGAASRPEPKPSVPNVGLTDDAQSVSDATRELPLIERAIVPNSRQPNVIRADQDLEMRETFGPRTVPGYRTELPAQLEPDNPTRADRRAVLDIQLRRLRQQNFITPDSDRTPISEGFRRIKRHILATAAKPFGSNAANLVMVTSALPGEGKTFCAVNLAISMVMEMDRTVLLVDADIVRPSVLPALGLDAQLRGLMDVLGDPTMDVGEVMHRTNIEKLSILPAGTPHRNAIEMLSSETMRALLRELAARYDDRIIIFDSPPLLVSSEAAVLASNMSQIIVVVASGQTTESALKDALKRLEGCGNVGLLLNKGSASSAGYYGYDGYG